MFARFIAWRRAWLRPAPLPYKLNDIRIVKITHHLPSGTTYETFEVQRFMNYGGFGWYGDYTYDTFTDADDRAQDLVKKYHVTKTEEVVVKEYLQP